MLVLKIAFRNLFRHKTRLVLNLILLVGAFSAIVTFKGFKTHVLESLKDVIIDTNLGHLQIAKQSFWDSAPADQVTDNMISGSSELIKKLSQIEGIEYISPRVSFYGLINSGEKSISAQFIGFQPETETKMQGRLFFDAGRPLSASKQLIIGSGLQKMTKVNPGNDVTIVSPTLDGSINALDVKVTGIFSTGFSDIDNGTVFLSLKDAGKILGSDHVDRLLITLKNEKDAKTILEKINGLLKNSEMTVKTWKEQADMYNQIENFYNIQSFAIEGIFILLLILSITNTVSMTVFERLSEIGTLRALGDNEHDIQVLFLSEAVLLGAVALGLSWPFSYILLKTISSFNMTLNLPFASLPMALEVIAVPSAFFEASVICFVSIVGASLWPSRKAAHVLIITALRAKV